MSHRVDNRCSILDWSRKARAFALKLLRHFPWVISALAAPSACTSPTVSGIMKPPKRQRGPQFDPSTQELDGMNRPRRKVLLTLGTLFALCLGIPACHRTSLNQRDRAPIVGAWLVEIPEAPFPLHMFIFHADGTVQQSNPDAGDPNTSDSNAMGVWLADGVGIKGKIVEITADRSTRQFMSRGEISFSLRVDGNAFSGTASAVFYDAVGRQVRGPVRATLKGKRVLP